MLEMADVQTTACALGLEVVTSEIRRSEDIAPAFEALKGRANALFVTPEPLAFTARVGINILAAAARLPTTCGFREYVEAGSLMSYGTSLPDQFRRTADFVDKILLGTKPEPRGKDQRCEHIDQEVAERETFVDKKHRNPP